MTVTGVRRCGKSSLLKLAVNSLDGNPSVNGYDEGSSSHFGFGGDDDEELLQKYPDVVKRMKKGLSVRDTAAACKVSTFTVQKVKKIFSGR